MNTEQERRVVEALQALTGGLTVTEQDILTAGNKLRNNLEPPSPRRRIALVAAAAAAVIVAGFVAFQVVGDQDDDAAPPVTTGTDAPADRLAAALEPNAYATSVDEILALPAPTAADLAGVWVLRPYGETTAPILVTGGGSYRYGAAGSFLETSLSEHTWTRRTPASSCPRTQSFTTGIATDGSLRMQVDEADNTCTITDGLEVWDPIGPGTAVADYWIAEADEADWLPVRASENLGGLYVAPATGHVLEVEPDGNYRFYDSLGADQLVPADQGELVTEPATLAASCTGGTFSGPLETTRLPGVENLLAGTTALRIIADNDRCASSVATDDVWVRLAAKF